MPRVGRHPLKGVHTVGEFSKNITVTTIVHAPILGGYWKDYLKILEQHFSSLYQNTGLPFDLMVFDNASCSEVKDYLLNMQDRGKIQYLILSSKNLRKTGALNFLLSTAPGCFVAYSDCDVYYLPGWLENSIKILNAFPKTGKVTAIPIAMNTSSESFKKYFQATLTEASQDPSIEVRTGSLVAEDFIKAHAASLNETLEKYLLRLGERKDYLIKENSVEAFISGADFQFVLPRKAVNKVVPFNLENADFSGDAIYQDILETNLTNQGFWQLSSTNYCVHHMGNQVPDMSTELHWIDPKFFSLSSSVRDNEISIKRKELQDRPFFYKLLSNRFTRTALKKVYLFLYKTLYE